MVKHHNYTEDQLLAGSLALQEERGFRAVALASAGVSAFALGKAYLVPTGSISAVVGEVVAMACLISWCVTSNQISGGRKKLGKLQSFDAAVGYLNKMSEEQRERLYSRNAHDLLKLKKEAGGSQTLNGVPHYRL